MTFIDPLDVSQVPLFTWRRNVPPAQQDEFKDPLDVTQVPLFPEGQGVQTLDKLDKPLEVVPIPDVILPDILPPQQEMDIIPGTQELREQIRTGIKLTGLNATMAAGEAVAEMQARI